MNIIYLLENIDKKTTPSKYIGFKTECSVVPLDGIPTIICNKEESYYFGSSTHPEMLQDLKNGNRFSATILEKVGDRKLLPERERYYLEKHKAETDEMYYNRASPLLHSLAFSDRPANMFGETILGRSSGEGARATRDAFAISQGFSNFGLMCFDIYDRILKGESPSKVSISMGKQRKFATRTMRDFDMPKAVAELEDAWTKSFEIRRDAGRQATLNKLHEIYGYEIPTLRIIIGDFKEDRVFKVARELGFTKEELEISITKRVLDGESYEEVSRDTGITPTSVRRYFLRCVRSRLKSSDL